MQRVVTGKHRRQRMQQPPDQATPATAAGTQLIASIPNAAGLKEYTDSRNEMGLAVIIDIVFSSKTNSWVYPPFPARG